VILVRFLNYIKFYIVFQ